MTTDPIRDEAVKVLAETVRKVLYCIETDRPDVFQWASNDDEGMDFLSGMLVQHLSASPTLARRIALGTAWDAAVAALPEGWRMQAVYMAAESIDDERWCATAYGPEDLEWVDPKRGYGPTPELALAALAAKLGSGK